jgi:elongation factor Ts
VVLPSGITADAHVTELIGKIGENISFRRYRKFDINPACERVATYVHGKGKIGVMVKLSIDKPETVGSEAVGLLGKDIAMQIAAANPIAANRDSIPAATIAKEKEIYFTQAQTSGKPDKIWDKIVEGKMVKFFQETVLTEQAFIRDTAMTVTDRIKVTEKETGAKIGVIGFTRLELGTDDEAAA